MLKNRMLCTIVSLSLAAFPLLAAAEDGGSPFLDSELLAETLTLDEQAPLAEAVEELEQAEQVLADEEAERDEAMMERDDAQTAVDAATTARDDAQTAVDTATTARDDAQTAVDAATTARDDAQTAVNDAQTALADAQAALQAAEDALADDPENEELQAMRDAAAQAVAEAEMALVDAEEALAAAETELIAKEAELAAKEEELAAKEAELTAKEEELAAKETTLAEKQALLDAEQADVDAAQMVVDDKAAIVQAIVDEIELTVALIDELSDEQVAALNRALHNAIQTGLVPFEIDSEHLQAILDGEYGVRQISHLITGFEKEARFERLAARFETRATETGNEKFLGHAERARAKGASEKEKFFDKIDGPATGAAEDGAGEDAKDAAKEAAKSEAKQAIAEERRFGARGAEKGKGHE
jgi:hypothetical protein